MTNQVQYKDYYCDEIYNWCTNCGNYAIHSSLKKALVNLSISPKDTLMCFDIGCHGNGSDKINAYTAHCLHGRVVPFACGASLANRSVKLIAFSGDGGLLSEGINHLIHAIRCDYDVMLILANNKNYGLTTGQASAVTPKSFSMNSAPDGVTEDPINHMDMIFTLNPSFVARGFSGDFRQLTSVFEEGLKHKGFSFIEILQDCPTYNKATPHEWYLERVFDVTSLDNYDPQDIKKATEVAHDYQDKIATGVIYKAKQNNNFLSRLQNRQDVETELIDEVRNYDIAPLLSEFK
jgi:2-oxoglutarate/2-oxoacid ferredoxin oxidoreductase subunit beta